MRYILILLTVSICAAGLYAQWSPPAGEPQSEPAAPDLAGTYEFEVLGVGKFRIAIEPKDLNGNAVQPDDAANWLYTDIVVTKVSTGETYSKTVWAAGLVADGTFDVPFELYMGTPNADDLSLPDGLNRKIIIAFGLGGNDKLEGSLIEPNWLVGGGGNDQIIGGDQKDMIWGEGGRDAVFGGGGSDIISGGPDNDDLDFDTQFMGMEGKGLVGTGGLVRIWGGGGNDLIYLCAPGYGGGLELGLQNYGYGGPGNDRIYGSAEFDWIWGDADSDVIFTSDQTDAAWGGAGSDTIYGAGGNDALYGDDGQDSLWGDRYVFEIPGGGEEYDDTSSTGWDYIRGGAGGDQITCNRGEDSLYGEGDNDTIEGGEDADVICGGSDADAMHGGDGNDTISGGNGIDQIYGEDGDDAIWAGSGDGAGDVVLGGAGNDFLDGESGSDTLLGEGASDKIQDIIPRNNDLLDGGPGNDEINCFDGNKKGSLDSVFSDLFDQDIVWADEFSADATSTGDDTSSLAVLLDTWYVSAVVLAPSDGRTKPVEP